MSSEALALETQLLLQEVTHANPLDSYDGAVSGSAYDAEEGREEPAYTEVELAKQSLVEKLRKKREMNMEKQRKVHEKRFGFTLDESKAQDASGQNGNAEQAENTYRTPAPKEPQTRPINLPVATSSRFSTSQKQQKMLSKFRAQAIEQGSQEMAKLFGYNSFEEQLQYLTKLEKRKLLAAQRGEVQMTSQPPQVMDEEEDDSDYVPEEEQPEQSEVPKQPVQSETTPEPSNTITETNLSTTETPTKTVSSPKKISSPTSKRSPKPSPKAAEAEDGNEADGEHEEEAQSTKPAKDRNATYRALLEEEARSYRRQRKDKNRGDWLEDEAEEDEEEENALHIQGLGDYGFGVARPQTAAEKEAAEERNALNVRKEDLDGIVDELSDDEAKAAADLDEIFRQESEKRDQEQVQAVMRNVKEGYGRNRRAFGSHVGADGARGRFNLNDLVAADGDRDEAKRLGLLESDEEEEKEEKEKEDEEAELERRLRERYENQPQIYITSSESENEEEEEEEKKEEQEDSDEEREKRQMKSFSEKARINRRMQRMRLAQEQGGKKNKKEEKNWLLDDEEEDHELLKVLQQKKQRSGEGETVSTDRVQSFSYTKSASFATVADKCQLFSNSGVQGRSFVFTSSTEDASSQLPEGEQATPAELQKSKSWSAGVKRSHPQKTSSRKKAKASNFFSALQSFDCAPQTTSSCLEQ